MEKDGIIYIATNLCNGKQNVGQTTRNLNQRIYEHQIGIGFLSLLHRAIKKYGIENFKWISYSCPEEDLDWTERFLIKELNTLAPNGYNLESGGNRNKHHHEITKKKISNRNKGRKITWSDKISKTRIEKRISKGINNPMYGKPRTEEVKQKISKTNKERGVSVGIKNPMYGIHLKHTEEWKRNRSRETKGENNPSAILTMKQVNEIRKLLNEKTLSLSKIAKKFEVSKGTIWKIKIGRIWKNVGDKL